MNLAAANGEVHMVVGKNTRELLGDVEQLHRGHTESRFVIVRERVRKQQHIGRTRSLRGTASAELLPERLPGEGGRQTAPIDAQEALRLGFVNRVVDDGPALDAAVQDYARKFSEVSPSAVRLGRRAFTLMADMPAHQALDAAQFFNLALFFGEDLREAARGPENLLPAIRQALKDRASLGEVCGAMQDVFGSYAPTF